MIPFCIFLSIIWIILYLYHCYYNTDHFNPDLSNIQQNYKHKSVAIIGAGPSGLITAKILIDYGHSVTIFEQSSSIGGSFKSSYNGYLTSSNFLTEFSMFPIQQCDINDKDKNINNGIMLTFSEYLNYLKRFVKTFNIQKYIKFNHKVSNIIIDNNKYIFYCENHQNNQWIFDNFVICTGIAGKPNIPQLFNKNNHKYAFDIIHSSQYIGNNNKYLNKNVLVLGLGESGSDISYYVSLYAKKCVLSSRNGPGTLVARYYLYGYPSDIDTSRAFQSCRKYEKYFGLIKFGVLYPLLVPTFWNPKVLQTTMEFLLNRKPFRYGLQLFATKSILYIYGIISNKIDYKSGIKRILSDKRSIQFEDNTIFENIDVVICCSGYISNTFEYLHENIGKSDIFNARKLYKHQFHPDFLDSFCFIGYNRPSFGSLVVLSELSARYYAQIISNIKKLANKEDMINDINRRYKKNENNFPDHYNTISTLVDFIQTYDEFGELIGCQPDLYKLFIINPFLWWKIINGPIMSCHYRIFGPNRIDIKHIQKRLNNVPLIPFGLNVFQFIVYCIVTLLDYFKKY